MLSIQKVTIAVNGGIEFGAKLTPKQLMILSSYDTEIELSTFQQLYVEVRKEDVKQISQELQEFGLKVIWSV
ncbi:hypothetical protein ACJROX_15135 [Pseudalkalibacillus sp. A8]|uniref:hypothetical protein n=1 Tax=Pseudalkalibacillus sp. A8 TaxID=3382641 RepID=UPI0038B4CE7A